MELSKSSAQASMAAQSAAIPATVKQLVLPLQVLTAVDVSRLERELSILEDFFTESAIRGASASSIPQTSALLTIFCNDNGLNLLQKADRKLATTFLKAIIHKSPIVHVSFATDPRPDFLMKLMKWFRTEAHPYVLFKIGLQPNIAAGCIVRTTNKYFDFSFKHRFRDSKQKLALALGGKV